MKPTTADAYRFFHKGTQVLARMERNGIMIDTEYLTKTIDATSEQIKEADRNLKSSDVWKIWKKRFSNPNIESGKQLSTILFKELGYKPKVFTENTEHLKGDKRMPKLDEYSLRHIDIPFVKDLFKAKKLRKVLGTYLKGIQREVCNGFLHPSYNLAGGLEDQKKGGAASYRGSSSNPNFQNIPIRNKMMGSLIRQCIKGRWKLVERDFSGLEVHIAFTYHKDRQMHRYLTDPKADMHGDQALVLFCLKEKWLSEHKEYYKKTVRDSAKNQWVFPQFYGSVWFQCAPVIWEAMKLRDFRISPDGITIREHLKKQGITKLGSCDPKVEPEEGTFARHLIDAERKLWQERFPVYTQWKKSFYNDYLNKGYFDLHTGFRCEGLFRRNQVINFPVQGAAFHCLLWCLIRLQEEIDSRGMRTLLVGQIHDSMLADVPDDELQEFLDLSEDVMTRQWQKHWDWINIPLKAEAEVCPINGSWFDKREYRPNGEGVWVAA
jgi:DNA polymerase-1